MTQETKITLSDGSEVTIGRLSWKGYKAIKNLIVKTVSGPVLTQAVSVISGPVGGILGDLVSSIISGITAQAKADEAQAELIAKLDARWNDASTAGMIIAALDQLKVSLGDALLEVLQTSDEFTELLIRHSQRSLKVSGVTMFTAESASVLELGLSVDDVEALRDAALDLNPLDELLELEKNWLGRLAKNVGKSTGLQMSSFLGGATSNTGSPEPTTGNQT